MPPRLRDLLLPACLTGLALVILVSLGNWQVRRLAWKEDLIARVETRPSAPAIDLSAQDLPSADGIDAFLAENEYRPALLRGEYRPAGEVLVFTSLERPRGPYGGPGHWILTPFVLSRSGAQILVNRGFVPDGRDDYAIAPGGEQMIEGLIRRPEVGSLFTPDPKPEERLFFSRDPTAIARAMGGAEQLGFFIDLDSSFTSQSGLPQAGETRFSFTNSHFQYAVTWYGLAAALLAVFCVFAWRRLKAPQGGRLTPPGEHP